MVDSLAVVNRQGSDSSPWRLHFTSSVPLTRVGGWPARSRTDVNEDERMWFVGVTRRPQPKQIRNETVSPMGNGKRSTSSFYPSLFQKDCSRDLDNEFKVPQRWAQSPESSQGVLFCIQYYIYTCPCFRLTKIKCVAKDFGLLLNRICLTFFATATVIIATESRHGTVYNQFVVAWSRRRRLRRRLLNNFSHRSRADRKSNRRSHVPSCCRH